MDQNGLIGRDGQLPWRLPADLQHFRRRTLGHTVLMGRKTWDSLGKPLDGRANWVLSRDATFKPRGARVFADLASACAAHAAGEGQGALMVIGGAQVYQQALPLARRLYLTLVQARLQGDTHFPPFDRAQFVEREREDHPADERHAHPFRFVTLERR